MRYIVIHAEDTPLWDDNFIRYAQAAIIRHRFTLGEFSLTDRQKMTLSRYLNPPNPISVNEIEADNDTDAFAMAETISGGGLMELFQV